VAIKGLKIRLRTTSHNWNSKNQKVDLILLRTEHIDFMATCYKSNITFLIFAVLVVCGPLNCWIFIINTKSYKLNWQYKSFNRNFNSDRWVKWLDSLAYYFTTIQRETIDHHVRWCSLHQWGLIVQRLKPTTKPRWMRYNNVQLNTCICWLAGHWSL